MCALGKTIITIPPPDTSSGSKSGFKQVNSTGQRARKLGLSWVQIEADLRSSPGV